MHNPNAVYFLLDSAPQRTVLLMGAQLTTTLFVQRNILDTRVLGLPLVKVQEEIAPKMPKGSYYSLQKGVVTAQETADVSDIIKQKAARARILSEGYGYLTWFANMATEAYWATSSIDFADTLLLSKRREEVINMFAATKRMSYAEAEKQIAFDEDNLLTLALRRKQIIWLYEEIPVSYTHLRAHET
jgi:hypothetical protein